MSDRLFGGILLVVAVIFAWMATGFDAGLMADPLGPQTFPIIIGVVMAIGCLYALIKPDPEPDWPAAGRWVEMAIAIVVLILYAVLLEELGFIVATALAVWVLSWRLGNQPGHAAAAGVVVAVVLFGLFDEVLGLPLPLGILKVG